MIGDSVQYEERSDGLWGEFRVLSGSDGDKALELFHVGVLTGLSAEFTPRKSTNVDGVVVRLDARIGNVALCRAHGIERKERPPTRVPRSPQSEQEERHNDKQPSLAETIRAAWLSNVEKKELAMAPPQTRRRTNCSIDGAAHALEGSRVPGRPPPAK